MLAAVLNDMWQAPTFWTQWKLNEAEICISGCDNTPLWAHCTIIDALKHLISPAGNSKHRKNKSHEEKIGWLLDGKVCSPNPRAFQMWQICNIIRFYWETRADVWKYINSGGWHGQFWWHERFGWKMKYYVCVNMLQFVAGCYYIFDRLLGRTSYQQ